MHAAARTFRRLSAAPLVSLVAVVSLAIGIAAPTIIFSLVNALVLKPLPVNDPGALVRIGSTKNRQGFYAFSYPDYTLLRDRNEVLAGIVAHQPIQLSWRRDGQAELAWAEIVSGNYFDVLGTGMAAGRGFVAAEDRSPGAHAVVVISHALWRQRFGGTADTVGSTIRINAHPFTIVGVTPAGYRGTFAGFAIDMWVPIMTQPLTMPDTADRIDRRDAMFLMLTGRLRPGIGLAQARAQLAPLAAELERLDPAGHEGIGVAVAAATGVHPFIQSFLPAFLALLFGAAALVLLIACANVSGLLIARGADRRKEIGIQLALGASRSRVVRMLLGESLMLAAGGTALGLLFTWWASAALRAYHPPAGIPIVLAVTMDERVAAFAALMALVTTLVVGVLPALQGSRVDVVGIIKSQGTATSGRARLRRTLIAVQVGLALVLLSAAALLQRGTILAARVDPGFDPSGVLVLSFEPRLAGMAEAATREFHRHAVDALSALPGVQAASVALFIPLGDRGDRLQVTADPSGRAETAWITYNVIDPRYLELLRIPIVRGRSFAEGDNGSATPVVIVTESMATRLWPGADPIGREVRIVSEPRSRTVVGIVRDGHYDSLSDAHRSFMFLPYAQFYRPDMVLHVRTAAQGNRAAMASLAEAVRQEIARLNADVPGSDVRPMEAATAWALVPGRVAGTILAIAGILALVLAAGGVYGIVSHAASRQTRELGIRIALGATRSQVLMVAMRTGLVPVVAGSTCGFAVSVLGGRALTGLLYGLSPLDPLSFSIAAATLFVVAGAASYLPARRVTTLDPIAALRVE